MTTNLDKLTEGSFDIIERGDSRIESYCEDTMMRGEPDMVIRVRDEQEVRELIEYCNANKIPLTFCASQTSMTGASVATEGVLVSIERLEGIIDIYKKDGRATVTARPGTVTSELQKNVSEAGWFSPVAPTSRDECRIGANVVTNVSGEDSYKYGMIRSYVRELKLIMADGAERTLKREADDSFADECTRAGYYVDWNNPIDLIIGSEGTLAFVKEVTLELLPKAPEYYTVLAPFPSNESALKFVVDVATERDKNIRALELADEGALEAMRTADGFPETSPEVKAFVYFKQEYSDDADQQESLERWYGKIAEASSDTLAESILIAETDKQKEAFRLWRHRVPEWANERGRERWDAGGGKIGSDWWVPVDKLMEMMRFFYDRARASGLAHMAYAHVGRGHPHTNLIADDEDEHRRAHELLMVCCCKAVELGGGVAGEHGLGKMHTDLLSIQHPSEVIERMRKWKMEYDPKWILGKGNIFSL
jgi:FAD/FMN-containing dehydrogenase